MICSNCGANISEGLKECEFCGSPVDVAKAGAGNIPIARSFVSLLSPEENKTLSSYMARGDYSTAQRFVMDTFGFNGPQAFEIIKQVARHKDAILPNMYILIENLMSESRKVLYFENDSKDITKVKKGAQNKYLIKLGYVIDERILLLYDNAIIKSGENGFTITNKCFYSSGSLLGDEAFVVPLKDIKTTHVDGITLFVNEKKVAMTQIDANDYFKVCSIVSRIIRMNR